MKFQIRWIVYLDVKSEFKADKLLNKLEKTLGLMIDNKKYEPHHEDKFITQASFTTNLLDEMDIQNAVFNTFQLVHDIGVIWSTYTPQQFIDKETGESVWSFEGTCDNPRITGIRWVQFVLQTNTLLEYGWKH